MVAQNLTVNPKLTKIYDYFKDKKTLIDINKYTSRKLLDILSIRNKKKRI